MKLLVICQNLAFDIDLQKIKLKHTKDKIKMYKRNQVKFYLLTLMIKITLKTKDKNHNIQKIKLLINKRLQFI